LIEIVAGLTELAAWTVMGCLFVMFVTALVVLFLNWIDV
jgi:hypothetical protein